MINTEHPDRHRTSDVFNNGGQLKHRAHIWSGWREIQREQMGSGVNNKVRAETVT